MTTFKLLNLALRFVLELCLLAAVGYGGWSVPGPAPLKLVVAIGLMAAVGVAWGLWLSPKRPVELGSAARLSLEVGLFALAAAALAATGHLGLAAALAVAYAINRILISVWRQG